MCSIRRDEEVPQVILRNGKWSRNEFQQSQVRCRPTYKSVEGMSVLVGYRGMHMLVMMWQIVLKYVVLLTGKCGA